QRGDVHAYALLAEPSHQGNRGLPPGVGDWNFYENIVTPACDNSRLPLHFRKVIGEDLKGNGAIGDAGQNIAGERLIVSASRLSHQRRVCGETLDARVAVHLQYSRLIGPVGK